MFGRTLRLLKPFLILGTFNGKARGYMLESHMYLIALNLRGFFCGLGFFFF